MPFEYHNPNTFSIDCSCRQPIGTLRVGPGEFLPSPEDEKNGITADLLAPFVCENLLHPTPPVLKRRLFRDFQIPIPADLAAATDHLQEFGGPPPSPTGADVKAIQKPAPAPRQNYLKTIHTGEIVGKGAGKTPSLDEAMAAYADQKCSSGRVKRPDNPQ